MPEPQCLNQADDFGGRHIVTIETIAVIKNESRFRRKRRKSFS